MLGVVTNQSLCCFAVVVEAVRLCKWTLNTARRGVHSGGRSGRSCRQIGPTDNV